MISLENKKILITGSTDGLGALLAIELSKLGAEIIVHGRKQERLDKTLSKLEKTYNQNHTSILCDLSDPETVKTTFSKINKLDILINNAGFWYEGSTVEMKPEDLINMVNVNLTSYLLISRLLLPILQKSNHSQVLNVSSQAGVKFSKDWTVYTATKFALQGFGESLALEYENTSTRVMTFYPGGMNTNIFTKAEGEKIENQPWMFDPMESVETIIFMLTRNAKVNIKRLDLINHLQK